jgi:HK97 family phage prohead protease
MDQRYLPFKNLEFRSDDTENPTIEGYFVVFDDIYSVCPGATESIRAGAFDESITGDVRALYNHNPDLILGRTSAGTLELRQDKKGLWGKITVNKADSDAMNAYERIKRGDVTGASFGFDIEDEEYEREDNGDIHWIIKKVNPLYEISPCTFPAYKATDINARSEQLAELNEQRRQELLKDWRKKQHERLGGINHGA